MGMDQTGVVAHWRFANLAGLGVNVKNLSRVCVAGSKSEAGRNSSTRGSGIHPLDDAGGVVPGPKKRFCIIPATEVFNDNA